MTTQHQPINLKIENAVLPEYVEPQTIAIQNGLIAKIAPAISTPATQTNSDIQNLFTPFGDGDPLKICTLLAQTLQLGTRDRHALCLNMATTLAAKAIGIHNHRIAPGSVADLVVVKAGSVSQVVGAAEGDRTTIKAGKIISQIRREQMLNTFREQANQS